MADAEGGERRSRWVPNDYAAFGAMFTASLVIRRHFQHWSGRCAMMETRSWNWTHPLDQSTGCMKSRRRQPKP